jgi:virginiamycin B lyase
VSVVTGSGLNTAFGSGLGAPDGIGNDYQFSAWCGTGATGTFTIGFQPHTTAPPAGEVTGAEFNPLVYTSTLSASGWPTYSCLSGYLVTSPPPPIAPGGTATFNFYAYPFGYNGQGTFGSGVAAGPDGALWISEFNCCYVFPAASQIERLTTAGVSTIYPSHGGGGAIVVGPDNALWFTESGQDAIGRMTLSGVQSNDYAIPTASSSPTGITVGPDGAIWFTEFAGNKIGRLTTGGSFSEYLVPTAAAGPSGIAAGPDGSLWFTESNGSVSQIGRLNPATAVAGTAAGISEFATPTAVADPTGIVAGPDGAMWFGERNPGKIGRITTAGVVTNEFNAGPTPNSIIVGPDGALWFTCTNGPSIGRITTTGTYTDYYVTINYATPTSIALGSDGGLWFATGGAIVSMH